MANETDNNIDETLLMEVEGQARILEKRLGVGPFSVREFIIKRSQEEGVTPNEILRKMEEQFPGHLNSFGGSVEL